MKNAVNFSVDGRDFAAVFFASLGMSNKFIEKKTGLTGGQICYRTRNAGVKRKDFRDGVSSLSRIIINDVDSLIEESVKTSMSRSWTSNRKRNLSCRKKSQ